MVIAEIGLNHLGDYKEVKSYLNTLLNTKVEGIEVQVRDSIFYARPEKKDLELNQQEYIDICQQIKDSGKNFGVALTDITKLDFSRIFYLLAYIYILLLV
jgi:sialic acid synthase SpsE